MSDMASELMKSMAAIQGGRGVDWPSMRKRLLKLGVEESLLRKAVEVTRYSESVYHVTIINKKNFDQLVKYAEPIDKSSRSKASLSGKTHRTNVNGALLVASTSTSETPYNYIFRDKENYPIPFKKHAMIIENLECFLELKAVYQFTIDKCGITYPENDIEFIWAAGNSISNKLIIPYLKSFEGDVLCVLDVDFGGLKIYSNLISGGLDINKTKYIVPTDIEERLNGSRIKLSTKELECLSRVYGVSTQTDNIIRTLRYYGKKLEQESYRAIQ
ncbi:hypothetical protein [uncultured Tolumonas sp.]|uniref:hypothetical protein n=1 Tax=uncultured Tolumonas sp. TaxID=263765 RepID=UPI002A0A3557|nr:hypothetical protein [uncultured Tolumonas sp.]